jgi:hypothetical protein
MGLMCPIDLPASGTDWRMEIESISPRIFIQSRICGIAIQIAI